MSSTVEMQCFRPDCILLLFTLLVRQSDIFFILRVYYFTDLTIQIIL